MEAGRHSTTALPVFPSGQPFGLGADSEPAPRLAAPTRGWGRWIQVAFALVIWAGCTSTQPDELGVTAQNEVSGTIGRTWHISGEGVSRLYAQAIALPQRPPGFASCPKNSGAVYELKFHRAGASILTATLQATGCKELVVGQDIRQTNEAFWESFRSVVGIDSHELPPTN